MNIAFQCLRHKIFDDASPWCLRHKIFDSIGKVKEKEGRVGVCSADSTRLEE
jgi:hypothetical protein